MPLLTINSTAEIASDRKGPFFEDVADLYAEVMDSETRFLAVEFRAVSPDDLWLGRAGGSHSEIVVLEADIRAGRPLEQRRAFALEFIEKIHDEWGIPHPNTKVVFTEHEGSQMMGYDRVGGDWRGSDDE